MFFQALYTEIFFALYFPKCMISVISEKAKNKIKFFNYQNPQFWSPNDESKVWLQFFSFKILNKCKIYMYICIYIYINQNT
jgi:hypothetical protein